jgi:DNA-binding transcriptional LysR family regulator
MLRNETKLMESAIALSEDLHFKRAARRLRISQPMLTKNIKDLELLLGGVLFIRDRKTVAMSDAGRAYVQHAKLSRLHGERAVHAARSVLQNIDALFRVGRSPYTDPFLISTLMAVHLPLFPRLKVELISQYGVDLIDDLLSGTLDLAIATEPPESALLTRVKVSEAPLYVAMAKSDQLARYPMITLNQLNKRDWILFERRLHAPLYDSIIEVADNQKSRPSNMQHIVSPEEAFPFVADRSAVAIVVKTGALRLARNGVTVRPLAEPSLNLRTFLVSRVDDDSRISSELVRAYVRKISDMNTQKQLRLPISA